MEIQSIPFDASHECVWKVGRLVMGWLDTLFPTAAQMNQAVAQG